MGLRTASVRHTNALVMAPALTEAVPNQSQNFTIPPSSPININAQNINDYGYSRDENSIKIPYTNGILKYNDKNQNQNQKIGGEINNKNKLNFIMSQGPNSMGDIIDDTMGLQRANMEAVASLLKDKNITNDVEQLLDNLDSVIPENPEVNPGDIGQNVDELMQVIKNMENSENPEPMETQQSASELQTNIQNQIFPFDRVFDQVLFNNVDMITNFDDEQLSGTTLKESRAKETIEVLHKKQMKLERRSEFLLRRLRKIQAKNMGQHVSNEVVGLFECIHRTLKRVKETDIDGNEDNVNVNNKFDEPILPINNVAIKNLVRKCEISSMIQSNSNSKDKRSVKYFGSGSCENNSCNVGNSGVVNNNVQNNSSNLNSNISSVKNLNSVIVQKLNLDTRKEIDRVSGMLQTEMKILEKQIDSDATASSSGGESADEMQTYTNPHQQFLSTSKRCAWRWAQERAAVASRWTWLQAQISDLEYRIRQHNELHRQIRACKGAVSLAEHHLITTQPQNEQVNPNAVNGYRGQLPGNTTTKEETTLHNGSLQSTSPHYSARTRPFNKSGFRKRKLIQTTGLHALSKKAGRPSNIRCSCVQPMTPCALCTGRSDPTFPRDMPEQLTTPERVALLDPGYHPVLSFPEDVAHSLHLEAIMKLPEWQQRSNRFSMKQIKGMSKMDRSDKGNQGSSQGLEPIHRPKNKDHRRKYNRLLKNSSNSLNSTTDSKHKISRGRKPFSRSSSLSRMKKRHTAKVAMAQLNQLGGDSLDEEGAESMGSSGVVSGSAPGSPSSHLVQVVPYRRNRVDSYDIDNIVIPYSVAASTRVEKLQYKEILTPKWRVIDLDFPAKYDVKSENDLGRRNSEDSDVEDVTDETIQFRHEKCEHEERKKFLSYIKFPLTSSGRSRANRRTDSRAESSGANTPDPMSPHNQNLTENSLENNTNDKISPIQSPQNFNTTTEISEISQINRRRTISNSQKYQQNQETFLNAGDIKDVSPYDLRNFPLSDEIYDKMLKVMPDGHPMPYFYIKNNDDLNLNPSLNSSPNNNLIDENICSPISDSTESAVAEDPNDPEWLDVEKIRDRTKR